MQVKQVIVCSFILLLSACTNPTFTSERYINDVDHYPCSVNKNGETYLELQDQHRGVRCQRVIFVNHYHTNRTCYSGHYPRRTTHYYTYYPTR